jgi:triacylglycerol lipase
MKKIIAATLLSASSLLISGLATADAYTQTKYPIVLAPGVLGFDKVLGIEYFYGIPAALSSGGAKVYVTSASAFNTSEARGEQLLSQVQTILAISGAQKVNLIGHSHGGASIRYVAGMMPSRVASLTAVGSPVKGTPVADLVVKLTANPALGELAATVGNAFSTLLDTLAGTHYSENILGSMASLSTAGSASFNTRFPAGVPTTACGAGAAQANGIAMYSWGGTSPTTNIFDPLDILFGTGSLAFAGQASDGLVGQCSNHFGVVLRDNYSWNHGDEINQLFGLRGLFSSDPKSVFRDQANRLKQAGL